jgi:hypothetical protein
MARKKVRTLRISFDDLNIHSAMPGFQRQSLNRVDVGIGVYSLAGVHAFCSLVVD